jgi:hypothetical protein
LWKRREGEGDEGNRMKSRKRREVSKVLFFSRALRKGKKRDSKKGFKSLEALPLSWLGGVFVPFRTLFLFLFFVVLGFLFINKYKDRCCRILLRWFGELCRNGGDIGVTLWCAQARSDKERVGEAEMS